jgi:DNA mismatch repair protein MutL
MAGLSGGGQDRHRILGQFRESFIVAADSEGLMLIDQHVAHERVLYEQAIKALSAKEGMASQALLFPETVPLTPEQSAMAEHFMEHLNRNGYDIDWFGSGTIVVRAVPVLAKGADIRNLIDDLLQDSSGLFDDISDSDSSEKITRLREKMAASLSCRAAIKVNTVLSHEKMEWLVDSLFQCCNPYTCPHGRPIVLKLETNEILKGFRRI